VSELADFLRSARLDRVGIFRYSKEEGTPAAEMSGQISETEKQCRYDELMAIQEAVSASIL
jgi:ribosomal protein S12 methylthiotransferase